MYSLTYFIHIRLDMYTVRRATLIKHIQKQILHKMKIINKIYIQKCVLNFSTTSGLVLRKDIPSADPML